MEQTPQPRLRPMALADMLDTAFRLYRRHFLTFVGIVALLQVPMAIVQFLAQMPYAQALQRMASRPLAPGPSPFDIFSFSQIIAYYALIVLLSVVQYLVVYNLITGALANAIARSYLGQPISIVAAYRIGARRVLALIGASLVPFVLFLLAFGLVAGCAFAAFWSTGLLDGRQPNAALTFVAALGLIGLVLLLMLGALLLYVRLLFTTQAIVIEGHGSLAGLRRSWRLVGLSFWRSVGMVLLVYVFVWLISTVVQLPMVALAAAAAFAFDNLALSQGLNLLATYAVLILVLPLQFIIFTLLYYDVRMRKEGYDLELIAQQAGP
ncbi:glycerophosphoryl diester phosphodiesterase membrane domain-containing protein [Kouleothrix sp.]|uniref:glycerophosphoryl diester phosphodiesterase membrane domain-containing protein n=1 Tax=Kouleothrix sp. TaxID=2779161 RepID=UPI00391D7A18